jgi:hypothetical protein
LESKDERKQSPGNDLCFNSIYEYTIFLLLQACGIGAMQEYVLAILQDVLVHVGCILKAKCGENQCWMLVGGS